MFDTAPYVVDAMGWVLISHCRIRGGGGIMFTSDNDVALAPLKVS